MNYSSQAIVVWDADLLENANALHDKRGLENEQALSRVHTTPSAITLPNPPQLDARSRLIVMGHGDPASTTLIGRRNLDPIQLAGLVGYWLGWRPQPGQALLGPNAWHGGVRIQHLSLHMCFGAGNPTGRENEGTTVDWAQSFAFQLAARCGQFAQEITGRTETVHITRRTRGGSLVDVFREVSPDNRHHVTGDKLLFRTNASSHAGHAVDPTVFVVQYAAAAAQ